MQTYLEVKCTECGNIFLKRAAYINRAAKNKRYKGRSFCNRHCFGRWVSKNGSPMVKGHDYLGDRQRVDKELIWSEHLRTGFGAPRLSRLLNIPLGTISNCLWKRRIKEPYARH
jgi:hypothetical protein